MFWEAVWYNGWIEPPAYILLDEVAGDTPEQAFLDNLDRLTQRVRDIYGIRKDEMSDDKIQDTLYLLHNKRISTYSLENDGFLKR